MQTTTLKTTTPPLYFSNHVEEKAASGEGFCTAHTRQRYFLDRLDYEKYMDS